MIWTPLEIDQLRASYSVWPPDLNALSLSLGRSRPAIKMKANELGLSKANTLKDEEKQYINKNASLICIAVMARTLKRSQVTVSKFIKENNLQVKSEAHNKWVPTESELEMIKGSHWSMIKELSEKIGRSTPLIRRHMRLIGIVKPIVPRVLRERKPRAVRIKPETMAPRNLDGENRIREAIARLGLNK